ncbi:MAG: flavodoxin family protein [Candidatus Firestonebacteria bacterium]|nr:flavodoxin family protein [Candidatus Firestonebacteria bacterium]
MFKLLAISGSPRRHGNSELLLDEFIKGAEYSGANTEKIIISEHKILPCTECLHCVSHAECTIKDDMQSLYPLLSEADGVVISTPVFFMGPPAQLKAMIDRCQLLWCIKYIFKLPVNKNNNKRKGFFLTLGALPKKIGIRNFQGNINSIKSLFHVLELQFIGYLSYHNIDKNGDIISHNNAMKEAYKAGVDFPL